ncbi:MAG: 30S ribosomal protein S17 [Candidatus Margulisbacteria bacterium]|nr:30S ribosomal protein S17 [Candidatus Margulisiibacteriota bacterium]
MIERSNRKKRVGIVVAISGKDTISVKVQNLRKHPILRKIIKYSNKFITHDPGNTAKVNDQVEIVECRPISKRKSWRLLQIKGAKKVHDSVGDIS